MISGRICGRRTLNLCIGPIGLRLVIRWHGRSRAALGAKKVGDGSQAVATGTTGGDGTPLVILGPGGGYTQELIDDETGLHFAPVAKARAPEA
jgi:hypothetical protein